MDAVIIRVENFPLSCKGFTILDENGDYNIYLNARYSLDTQANALKHEVYHIKKGHFFSTEDVQALEELAKFND